MRRTDEGPAEARVYKVIGSFARDRAFGEATARKEALARDGAGSQGAEAQGAAQPDGLRRYRLYARLWSGAGNLILVDEDGIVVDGLARRPGRGEVSGSPCRLEEELAAAAAEGRSGPRRELFLRDLPVVEDRPGGGSFNERTEAFYAAQGGELSRERLIEAARERFAKRKRTLEARISDLEARSTEYRDADRLRELGDILMANQEGKPKGRFLDCDDFFRGGSVAIEVDPAKGMVENARAYYERYRKAGSGLKVFCM